MNFYIPSQVNDAVFLFEGELQLLQEQRISQIRIVPSAHPFPTVIMGEDDEINNDDSEEDDFDDEFDDDMEDDEDEEEIEDDDTDEFEDLEDDGIDDWDGDSDADEDDDEGEFAEDELG